MVASERSVLSIAELSARRVLVERPGPGRAPTAFRIWASGTNVVDGKSVVFSERSAAALLAEQESRGRLYSFDFDHRSMLPDSTPEAGKAAGWHVLEVRRYGGKPELWARSCDWTTEARTGLEATPPTWRYFSPCYEVDPKTREILSYVGCALTNNPLTHGVPALASATRRTSDKESARFELARVKLTASILRASASTTKRAEVASRSARTTPNRAAPRASVASVNAEIVALAKRVERAEAASAAAAARVDEARPEPAAADPVVEMIERSARNTRESLTASQRAAIIAAGFDR